MDKLLLQEIKNYIKVEGRLSPKFGKYSKIYSMTTENISDFLKNFDLKDKTVLTVAGSGDQRLNSYLMGAKHVTCFDINPLTELQIDLKDKIITHVNYEKFVKFFGIYSRKYDDFYNQLDERIFDEIKSYLTEETCGFFKFVINDEYINSKDIYFKFKNNLDKLQRMNNYLDIDNYYLLSTFLKNKEIDFINSNIATLKEKINKDKYDFILLSNISDYIDNIYGDNYLEQYRLLIDSLTDNLNDNGIIQVGYIYGDYSDCKSDFSNDKKRDIFFNPDRFNTIYVDSFDNQNIKDKIIVYKKV